MNWDLIAVIVIVALAATYVIRRQVTERGGCGECCGCDFAAGKPAMKRACNGRKA